jgi:Bifunctional DNA primase/polymerase, N-terminal
MIDELIGEYAGKFIDAGFAIIPLSQSSKQPVVKWKELINDPIKKWEFKCVNIAMLTGDYNKYVVVDCDTKDGYKGWLKHRPRTPLRVKTPKGMHFYYRHPGVYVMSDSHIVAKEGFKYDIKGDKSYVVAPPSISGSGRQYQVCVCTGNIDGNWLMPNALPVFDPSWRPMTVKTPSMTQEVKDAYKIIQRIQAREGERDKQTYHVIMLCLEGKISEAEAIQAVTQWHQTNCNPPWSAVEIIEKVRRVYQEKRK